MAGVTTTSTVSGEYQTYYTDYLLKHAVQLLKLDQFADMVDFPKNAGAKAIRFFKKSVAAASNVQDLVEGTAPASSTYRQLTLTPVDVTLAQYGEICSATDVLSWTDKLRILKETISTMIEDCALKADSVIRNEIIATNNTDNSGVGTNTVGTDLLPKGLATQTYVGLSGVANTDTTTQIAAVDVLAALTVLKTNRAPMINGEYVGVFAPAITFDLMRDSKWFSLAQYSKPEGIVKGEVGKFYGVKVVEATNPWTENATEATYSVAAGANSVYASFFMGKGAYGCPKMAGQSPFSPKVIMVDTADHSDPLLQQFLAGWKAYWAAKLYQSNWLIVLRSKSGSGIVPVSSPQMDSSLPDVAPEATQERLCAPLTSLEVGGVAPQVGDAVQVTVEGTVSEIDGDKAYIDPDKVNGQDVQKDEQPDEGESGLDRKAAQLDAQGY